MVRIAEKLQKIQKEVAKTFVVEYFGHKFEFKFLSEKEEREVMEELRISNLEGYAFVSRLNSLQIAWGLVSVDEEPAYSEEEMANEKTLRKSKLEVAKEFENWDGDVLSGLLLKVRDEKIKARRSVAKELGIDEDKIDNFVESSSSTLDQFSEVQSQFKDSLDSVETAVLSDLQDSLKDSLNEAVNNSDQDTDVDSETAD